MGLYYYLRIILVMIDQPDSQMPTEVINTPIAYWVMGGVILLVIGIGIFPAILAGLVQDIIG